MSSSTAGPAPERRGLLFSGRVQGVGFRVTVQQIARRNELTGFVRNVPDGRVEAEIQGSTAQIEAALADITIEFQALITKRESKSLSPVAGEATFEIRF